MARIYILSLALLLLVFLLYFRKKESRVAVVVTKTLLSALFVYSALHYPSPMQWYFTCILGGLILCFLGDVLLAFAGTVAFRIGLVFFLIGHVSYSVGFFSIAQANWRVLFGIVPILFCGGLIYRRLKPHLGSMNIPVMAYIMGISVMLSAAVAVLLSAEWSCRGRLMVFFGAVLFYLSDYLVARNRFIRKQFTNRLIGLPMYYSAQFLVAFSLTEL